MHPMLDAKRGIMRSGVLETISAEGNKTLSCILMGRTAFKKR